MWNQRVAVNKNIKPSLPKFIENKSGSILITVLLIMGIFSGLLYSVLQINTIRNTTQRSIQQIGLAESLKDQIHNILKDSNSCQLNLRGKDNSSTITELRSAASTNPRVFKVGDIYTYSNYLGLNTTEVPKTGLIKLEKITLDNIAGNRANLRIAFNKLKPTTGSPVTQKTLELQVNAPSGVIDTCSARPVFSITDFCQNALDGTPSGNTCKHLFLPGHVTSGPFHAENILKVNGNTTINGDVTTNVQSSSYTINISGSVTNSKVAQGTDLIIARDSIEAREVSANTLCYNAGDGTGCSTCIERDAWQTKTCGTQRMVSISMDGTIICAPWN